MDHVHNTTLATYYSFGNNRNPPTLDVNVEQAGLPLEMPQNHLMGYRLLSQQRTSRIEGSCNRLILLPPMLMHLSGPLLLSASSGITWHVTFLPCVSAAHLIAMSSF